MDMVLDATSLPVVLLGGEVSQDQAATFETWRRALTHPTARGLVVGRSLLFPSEGAVREAVDAAVGLMR
jgi:DhnA family fructose-bisphosphate aldolase class Ia